MSMSQAQLSALVQRVLQRVEDGGGGHIAAVPGGGTVEGVYPTLDAAVAAANKAQQTLEWHRSMADRARIIEAMRAMMRDNLETIARLAVEETGLGRVDHKVIKNRLVTNKTPGTEDLTSQVWTGDHGLTLYEFAPWGVIGAICPTTNPSETVICNAIGMIAAGNAVVFQPHPSAKRVTHLTIGLLNRAIVSAGGPPDLITTIAEPTMETATALMKHPGIRLLVVTGGPGVVKAAMASGKKTIAAGPGNPPSLCDETADLEKAGRDMVNGASFDNNIICCDEKEFIAVASIADELKGHMRKAGAFEVDADQAERLMKAILATDRGPGQHSDVNKKFVGKDAGVILREIGINVGPEIKLVIAEVNRNHTLLHTEQLMPVIPFTRVRDFHEGLELAREVEHGYGHTSSIHSRRIDRMSEMARVMNTAIFVKNGAHYSGLGEGGEGPTSFTIAHPTGEGLTYARHFSRMRRCALVDALRIV
ncbi:MAG: aldehyde dehydrogenase family protein [Candidatus Sericytochromatia bacterium]|nr:aldehyde dehydrogenase family protein [Candidatus Sericytochromatia bacterium]